MPDNVQRRPTRSCKLISIFGSGAGFENLNPPIPKTRQLNEIKDPDSSLLSLNPAFPNCPHSHFRHSNLDIPQFPIGNFAFFTTSICIPSLPPESILFKLQLGTIYIDIYPITITYISYYIFYIYIHTYLPTSI